MAKEDAEIAALLFGYLLPGAVGLGVIVFAARRAPTAWQWMFATLYSRFLAHVGHRAVKGAKEELFHEMSALESFDWQLKSSGVVRILEIGVGTGTNFEYYPKNCHLVCYDPNPYFRSYLFDNALDYPHVRLERLVVASGERLVGTQDETVDAVVTTLVLCSVQDLDAVLREVMRVLPKGGKYFFIEHVRAHRGTLTHRLQHLVNFLWKVLVGCNLLTDVAKAVKKAGFSHVSFKYFNMVDVGFPLKQLTEPCIMGVATK